MQAMSSQSTVTLTNWERLENSPLPLAGASAVEWNDHVFVLDHDGISLLYHKKSGIWSALPKAPFTSSNTISPPLTVHNGQILTMSSKGEMATFDPKSSDWKELKDMNLLIMDDLERGCVLVSYNTNLYAIVSVEKTEQKQGKKKTVSLSIQLNKHYCTIYSYDPQFQQWSKDYEFGQGPLQSAVMIGDTMFVHTGEEMYKLVLKKKEEKPSPVNESKSNSVTKEKLLPGSFSLGVTPIKSEQMFTSKTPKSGGLSLRDTQASLKTEFILKNTPKKVANPPYKGISLYTIEDTLFSFGGRDEDNQPTSDVLRYNPDTDTWESAGYMRSARYNVAVTTIEDTALSVLVIGGVFSSSQYTVKKREYTNHTKSTPLNSHAWNSTTSIVEKCTVNN